MQLKSLKNRPPVKPVSRTRLFDKEADIKLPERSRPGVIRKLVRSEEVAFDETIESLSLLSSLTKKKKPPNVDDLIPEDEVKAPKRRPPKTPMKKATFSLDDISNDVSSVPTPLPPLENSTVLEIRPGVFQSARAPVDKPLLIPTPSDPDKEGSYVYHENADNANRRPVDPSTGKFLKTKVEDRDQYITENLKNTHDDVALTKRMRKRLYTLFGQRSDVIINMLEVTDTDPAAALITRTLLQTLVDVLPQIEKSVRSSKGQRGVMSLNQTISQMRELVADLQSFKDKANIGQSVVDRHVRPSYMDVAVQVSMVFVEVENFSRDRMSPDDFVRLQDMNAGLKRSFSDFLLKQYQELSKTISKSL